MRRGNYSSSVPMHRTFRLRFAFRPPFYLSLPVSETSVGESSFPEVVLLRKAASVDDSFISSRSAWTPGSGDPDDESSDAFLFDLTAVFRLEPFQHLVTIIGCLRVVNLWLRFIIHARRDQSVSLHHPMEVPMIFTDVQLQLLHNSIFTLLSLTKCFMLQH